MSKRAMYSIPLASLALSSAGCPEPPVVVDELINTFSVDVLYNEVLPDTYVGYDVNGDGSLICDSISDANDITFAADLTADLTLTTTYANCQLNGAADPASDGLKNSVLIGLAASVVTINAAYTIVATDANGAQFDTLDCTLNGNALECVSGLGGGGTFTFTKQ